MQEVDGRDRRPHQITGQARTRTRIIRYSNTSRPPKSRITRVKPYYEPYIMSCLRIRHCNFLSAPGTEYGTAGVTTGGRGVPALISRGQVGRGGGYRVHTQQSGYMQRANLARAYPTISKHMSRSKPIPHTLKPITPSAPVS